MQDGHVEHCTTLYNTPRLHYNDRGSSFSQLPDCLTYTKTHYVPLFFDHPVYVHIITIAYRYGVY